MNIKFTLLLTFVLASLNVNTSPLTLESPNIPNSPVLQNEIEVTIIDASYAPGDTYTIKVYHLGMLYSSQTTSELLAMATIPTLWRGTLDIEVEKHSINARVFGGSNGIPSLIIAQEVRHPGLQTIIEFEQL